MATIDDRDTIDRIIAANGRLYDDEPPVVKIVEYENAWGKTTWGVIWETDNPNKYAASDYIKNPKVIFDVKT